MRGRRMSHSMTSKTFAEMSVSPSAPFAGQRHPVAGIAQRIAHERPEVGLVVNEEDVEHVRLRFPVTRGDDLRIRKNDLHGN